MRGKAGFVLGAALGYILGTRAGRARYEQIKRGAAAVWETPLVQQGVTAVKGTIGDGVDGAKDAAVRLVKAAFDAALHTQGRGSKPADDSETESGAVQSGESGGSEKTA